jgi:hypothetical protein
LKHNAPVAFDDTKRWRVMGMLSLGAAVAMLGVNVIVVMSMERMRAEMVARMAEAGRGAYIGAMTTYNNIDLVVKPVMSLALIIIAVGILFDARWKRGATVVWGMLALLSWTCDMVASLAFEGWADPAGAIMTGIFPLGLLIAATIRTKSED